MASIIEHWFDGGCVDPADDEDELSPMGMILHLEQSLKTALEINTHLRVEIAGLRKQVYLGEDDGK